jgi:hypothetical protein
MFLRLIEALLYVALVLGTVSQVMIPLWRNRPLFPYFRERRKIESKFGEVVEKKEVDSLTERMRRVSRTRQL